jgi:hypothetical protein
VSTFGGYVAARTTGYNRHNRIDRLGTQLLYSNHCRDSEGLYIPMLNQMSVELLARDLADRRVAEARMEALAAQLPPKAPSLPAAAARHVVASSLRLLAYRLDPSLASEPRMVAANSR